MSAKRETSPAGHLRLPMTIILAVIIFASPLFTVVAQEKPQERKAPIAGLPDLVGGLKATPGCIGVETARTSSGKNVIFAWFEDKTAVLRWYYNEMHQGVLKSFVKDYKPHKPLEAVPDDVGPIMAVASLTMADKSHFEGVSLPISQISIELYKPVTGGIFLGHRFAPDSLKIPGMRDLTPRGK